MSWRDWIQRAWRRGRSSSARSATMPLSQLDAQARGRLGENRAVERLVADGCRVLARNRRVAGVEIDVIAFDPRAGTVLVVEVKSSGDGRPPERRVDPARRRRLVRAATLLGVRRRVAIEVAAVDLRTTGVDSVRRIRLEPADLDVGRAQRGR